MKKEFSSTRFWSNVEILMKEKEMTTQNLSLAIGATPTYIVNASRNKGVPNISTALGLAEVFGTTVEELAFGNVGLELRKERLLKELEQVNKELAEIK